MARSLEVAPLSREEFARHLEAARPHVAAALSHRLSDKLRRLVDVEDVWQETVLSAMNQVTTFAWKGELAFHRWLMTLARCRLADLSRQHFGRNAEHTPVEIESLVEGLMRMSAGPATHAARRDDAVRLHRAIAALPPVQREVLAMDVFHLLTPEEIAQRLGKSKATVQRAYLRALQTLQRELRS